MYLVAVLEDLSAELAELAGNASRGKKKKVHQPTLPDSRFAHFAFLKPLVPCSSPFHSHSLFGRLSARTRSSTNSSAGSPLPKEVFCPTFSRSCCRRRASKAVQPTQQCFSTPQQPLPTNNSTQLSGFSLPLDKPFYPHHSIHIFLSGPYRIA